jgi:hypothetical protein
MTTVSSRLFGNVIARFVTGAFLAWSASVLMAADSYCAFEVEVHSPLKRPALNVPVGIGQLRSTFAQTLTNANGIARLCDAPIGPVDVFVGFDACGLVVIKDVKPLWRETKKLFVTYARSSCGEFNSNARNCHIILRVKDETGHPLAGARFEGKASESTWEPLVSDSFGRLFREIEADQTLEGYIAKLGYNPTPISHKCLLQDADRELVVSLRKR